MDKLQSDFTYEFEEGNIIVIYDEDKGGRSVTNDIGNVLAYIALKENIDISQFKIAYRDSEGYFVGVAFQNGYPRFFPIDKDRGKVVHHFYGQIMISIDTIKGDSMKYVDPKDVTGPKYALSNVRVILNDGEESISIAKVNWNGQERFAMRWNVSFNEWNEPDKIAGKMCLGMPVSRANPVWFIIPDGLLDPGSDLYTKIQRNLNEL